jgi:hypothetical protein
MNVTLENYVTVSALRCPYCSETYLHQGGVAIFEREEDADQVKVVTVSGGAVHEATIANNVSLNPSPRRYGLRISFWCEHCSGAGTDEEREHGAGNKIPDLAIYQHKGETFIEWMV